jgi:hypothetical protein
MRPRDSRALALLGIASSIDSRSQSSNSLHDGASRATVFSRVRSRAVVAMRTMPRLTVDVDTEIGRDHDAQTKRTIKLQTECWTLTLPLHNARACVCS